MEEDDLILGESDERSEVIQDQIDILMTINEMDFSALYDDWNEQKIKVINRAKDNYCRSNGIYVLRLSTAKSTRFEQRIFEVIQTRLEKFNKPAKEPKKKYVPPVKKKRNLNRKARGNRPNVAVTIDDYNALYGCGHRLTNRVIAEIK